MPESEWRPVVLHEAECEEGWSDERNGRVQWRTLISSEITPTDSLTAGVAELGPEDQLKAHRHAQPEMYHVLAGEGVVRIEGTDYPVESGSTVFVPGNAIHGIRNAGRDVLRFFYVFAADSFGEVAYVFQE